MCGTIARSDYELGELAWEMWYEKKGIRERSLQPHLRELLVLVLVLVLVMVMMFSTYSFGRVAGRKASWPWGCRESELVCEHERGLEQTHRSHTLAGLQRQ
jgi:hypothetical protein